MNIDKPLNYSKFYRNRQFASLRRKRTNPGYVRLRNSAQIRVLEPRRVLHNVYLILIGVKLRSILDEFWLGIGLIEHPIRIHLNWSKFYTSQYQIHIMKYSTGFQNTNLYAISQTDITGVCSFAAQARQLLKNTNNNILKPITWISQSNVKKI